MIDNLPEKIYIQDFRTLTVWKKSTVLAQKMYKIVKFFPEIEKYIMVSQILRCSTSISANLAEGNSQLYKKKEISFANNALGSAGETKHWIEMAYTLGYIDKKLYDEIIYEIDEIIKLIIGYIKKIKCQLKEN